MKEIEIVSDALIVYAVVTVLACLLLVAVWYDLKFHRIPNKLILVGILLGVLANALLPKGSGYAGYVSGALGWADSLRGLGMGFVVLLPFYLLRAMGAGDVKLMAMVGAFLGPAGVLGAIVFTFLAGGVMAIAVVIRTKKFRRLMQNYKYMYLGSMIKISTGKAPVMDDMPESVGKLPYAVAIAVGTMGYVIWRRIYGI